jgi:hypothetical protein
MQTLNKTQALDLVRKRRDLFDMQARSNPFTGSDWLLHFIAQIAEENWEILAPEDHLDGCSTLLLYRTPDRPHHCAALTNYYASLYSPLVSSATDRAGALDRIVGQLAALTPAPASIGFAPLDTETTDTAALMAALTRHGWYARQYFCFGNWYLPCEGLRFEEYMQGRDSRLFNTWTRKAKKFDRGKDGARLQIVTDPAEVDAALEAYDRVYGRSWKTPEPYPQFVPGWARICAERGWLRLGLAWVGDVPVAAQIWFTQNQRACIFKLAYDEDYAGFSAGTVLTAHLFRHALEQDRVTEIDYLTGDDAYKRSWMSHRRERTGLLACNLRTPRGVLTAAKERAGELRQRWRRPEAAGAPGA